MHELVPEVPFRHGHAISIDMAYSATLANDLGYLSDDEHRRILGLFSKAGLSMDHFQFDEDVLDEATKAILKTRDGLLRAAVPNPIGSCSFINDVTQDQLNASLKRHKQLMKGFPRNGEGLEAFVDASDTGYTDNNTEVDEIADASKKAGELNGNGHINGGIVDGADKINGGKAINGHTNGAEKNNEAEEGLTNGVNGYTNGARA